MDNIIFAIKHGKQLVPNRFVNSLRFHIRLPSRLYQAHTV